MEAELAYNADLYINGLVACATVAWFLYEILITLEEEIEYVWKSSWSLPKVLYLISRYFGLLTLMDYTSGVLFPYATLSPEVNAQYTIMLYYCTSVMFTGTVVDGLLLLRVMALYSLRPRVRLLLKALYVLENCVQYILLVLSLVQTALGLYGHPPDAAGCLGWMSSNPLLIVEGLLPSLLFNVVLFFFIANALLPFWVRSSWTPLFDLFFRDAAVYVFLSAGTEFLMLITTITFRNRAGVMLIGTAWLTSILPIASCRLVLNLRGALRAPRTDSTMNATGAGHSVIDIRRRNSNDTGFASDTEDTWHELDDAAAERGEQAA